MNYQSFVEAIEVLKMIRKGETSASLSGMEYYREEFRIIQLILNEEALIHGIH